MNNPNRKPNRLQYYHYSKPGYYLATICAQNRIYYFGQVEEAQMRLSDIGQIATHCWRAIPEHFHNATLDEFVVMPNHIHGIIVIKGNNSSLHDDGDDVGNNDRCSFRNARNMQLLPKIISQYKSSVTRTIRKQWNNHRFGWQKSFYERVIRNDEDLYRVRAYIQNNPLNWELDKNNLANWNVGNNDRCSP